MLRKNDKIVIGTKCYEYLIRVCKNNNFYKILRERLKQSFDGTPYTQESLVSRMITMCDNELSAHHFHKGNNPRNEIYDYVMVFTNTLLHCYMENSEIHPRYLEAIGQSVFDSTCYSIFGADYLKEAKHLNDGHSHHGKTPRETMLMAECDARRNNGENISLERLKAFYAKMNDDEFWNCHGGDRMREMYQPFDNDDKINFSWLPTEEEEEEYVDVL